MFLLEKIVHNWANALFDLYFKNNKINSLEKNLKALLILINRHQNLILFFYSQHINYQIKHDFIFKKLSRYFDTLVLNFLGLLIVKKKIFYLEAIMKAVIALIQKHKNIQIIYVYSTIKLTKKQEKKIKAKFTKILNQKIEIVNKIDLNLIGGIKIKINQSIYDYSIREQILKLKNKLLNLKLIN